MEHCTPLTLDMMAYTLLRHLSDSSLPVLDNDASVSSWLLNLAEFFAHFLKKNCSVDMVPLMTYFLNRMRFFNESTEMIILKEVIARMFGWS